jgi:hypothetical protein
MNIWIQQNNSSITEHLGLALVATTIPFRPSQYSTTAGYRQADSRGERIKMPNRRGELDFSKN